MADGDEQPDPGQPAGAQPLPAPGELHWGDWERMPQRQQPQKPFEPYRAILPARPPAQWAQPDFILDGARKKPGLAPGPFMPQARDVPNVLQSLFGGLGKSGSPQVRSLILAAAASHSGWLNSYLKGWEMRQKMLHQQFSDNLEQAQEAQRKESEQYAVAFAKYPDGSDKQREAVRAVALAQRPPDKDMLEALNSGDPAAPHRVQQVRDGYWLSGEKYRSQTAKQAEDDRKRKLRADLLRTYGIDPDKVGGVPGTTTTAPDSETPVSPEEPAVPAPAPASAVPATAPAEESAPVPGLLGTGALTPPPAGPQLAQTPPRPSSPAARTAEPDPEEAPPYQVAGPMMPPPTASAENVPDVTPVQGVPGFRPGVPGSYDARADTWQAAPSTNAEIRHMAHQTLMGIKPDLPRDREMADIISTVVRQQAAYMRDRIERIRTDPRYEAMPPEERTPAVLADLRKADAELAADVQNYLEGAPTPRGVTASKTGFQLAFSLAHKADPSFDANNPNARADLMREYTRGQSARTLIAAATADDHVQFIKSLAEKLRPYQYNRPLWTRLRMMYLRQLAPADNPQEQAALNAFTNYADAVHLVAPEIARAQSGAAPTVHGIADQEEYLSADLPVDTLLQHLDNRRELFAVRVKELRDSYQEKIGNPRLGMQRVFQGFEQRSGWGGIFSNKDPTADDAVPVPPRSGKNFNDAMAGVGRGLTTAPTGGANSIAAPPGAREGETLYFRGRPYLIRGGQAIPQ